jgi:hypothetical protein
VTNPKPPTPEETPVGIVTRIRCYTHRDISHYNRATGDAAECAACAVAAERERCAEVIMDEVCSDQGYCFHGECAARRAIAAAIRAEPETKEENQ